MFRALIVSFGYLCSNKSRKSHLLEREVTQRISHIRPSQKSIFETEN